MHSAFADTRALRGAGGGLCVRTRVLPLHEEELIAVAVYFLNMKTFGRANGSSAASAVAYRAGERIRDERTGRTYDHSERQDVMHKEIVLPSKFAGDDIAWARDRNSLWNAAEAVETRKNARIAREYLVALPFELSPQGRVGLVKSFSQELSDRYGFAVD